MEIDGKKLKKLIESKNKSVNKFCINNNISPQTVNKLINSKVKDCLGSTLIKLANLLDVNPQELYKENK